MEHRRPLAPAAGHRIADLEPKPLVRHPLAQAFVEILRLLGFHNSTRLAAAEVKRSAAGEARQIYPRTAADPSPTTRPVEATDYKVRLEIFEGPLDLLLYLIKKDEVDIHSISIERITRQYLDYINTFKLLNIDLASEFIVMAANLMYLKSRTLLPRVDQPPEEDAEEDDPRWELIRQLIEYKKFKDAAGFLCLRELEQEGRFAHQPDAADLPAEEPASARGGLDFRPDPRVPERAQALRGIPRFRRHHRRPLHRFRQNRAAARPLRPRRVAPLRRAVPDRPPPRRR